ncbi:MAG: transporter related [Bacteroidota bacterium]|nr:transporter related [Bacteroidota bacterium]
MGTAAAEKSSPEGDIITIDHLKKSFGGHEVLKDISLKLAKGENLVIMGKSGTGKSVLIKCIVRLIEPDAGEIKILGKDVLKLNADELNDVRKKIGFLFQSAALYDSMTVRENLEFPLREVRKKNEEIEQMVEEALKNVGLLDVIDKMPSELSGGMRKRIGLARTLILRPEVILYDEPNTGLDPITTREISKLIVELKDKYQTSSIIITHDSECARITANRIMIINEGLCVAEGTYEELEKSEDEFVSSFFTKQD